MKCLINKQSHALQTENSLAGFSYDACSNYAIARVLFMHLAPQKFSDLLCLLHQSISNGSALKGAAFWAWYDEGQIGPEGEGGGSGWYGINDTSSTFDLVRSNAKAIAG